MGKKPFGCLTVPGLITAVLIVLIVIGVGLVRGGVLFSPGALNAQASTNLGGVTSHAELSAKCSRLPCLFLAECEDGRSLPAMPYRCGCPAEGSIHLARRSAEEKPGMPCRSCHPDHRGADAALIDMSMARHIARSFWLLAQRPPTPDGWFSLCVQNVPW